MKTPRPLPPLQLLQRPVLVAAGRQKADGTVLVFPKDKRTDEQAALPSKLPEMLTLDGDNLGTVSSLSVLTDFRVVGFGGFVLFFVVFVCFGGGLVLFLFLVN